MGHYVMVSLLCASLLSDTRRINTRSHTKEKSYIRNFCKIEKAKNVKRVSKICVCMQERYVPKEFLCIFPGD